MTVLTNILFTLLFNNGFFFIENYRGMKIPRKIIFLLGVCSMILSGVCLFLLGLELSIPSIIITGIIGTSINVVVDQNLKLQAIFIRSASVLLLFFVISLVQIIPIILFSIDVDQMNATTESYLNLFSSICLLAILLFIYWKDLKVEFQLFWKNKMKNMDIGFKYWFLGLIIMIASNTLILLLLPKATAGNEEAVQEFIHATPWISLISTGILAPIIEEITFRKTFRDAISNDTLFILVSGFIFGGLHVVLSITSIYDLAYLIPYCSLGISFGFIYVKTRTIFTSISIHMLHNFALTLLSIVTTLVILC